MLNKTACILQSNGFIVHRLTCALSQDVSQGYGWHCFDIRRGRWDEGMLGAFGLPARLLPPIAACHQVVGAVHEAAARETGLLCGTPVVAGGLDAACGALGAGVLQPGETQEQGGQAGGMSICLDACRADRRLILGYHVVPGRWLLQGGTVGGAGVMRWFQAQFGAAEEQRGREEGISTLDAMNRLAAGIPAGSEGVLFLPYMAGERSPIWDARAKGVFYGLDFGKTRGHLLRAAMEGVAYALEHNLAVAREAGAHVGVLRSVGGAANSRLWTQIKADVTGREIQVPDADHATNLGAALLAGVGTGVYADFDDAVRRTVRIRRTHVPDAQARGVYQGGFSRYLALYEALRGQMHAAEG